MKSYNALLQTGILYLLAILWNAMHFFKVVTVQALNSSFSFYINYSQTWLIQTYWSGFCPD